MQKIRLFIHRNEASVALRTIQKLGVLQLTEINNDKHKLNQRQKEIFEFNYVSGRLDFTVKFLSEFAEPAKGLKGMIEGTRVYTSGAEIYKTATSFYYNDIIDSAETLQEKLNDAHSKIKSLQEERNLLSQWKALDFSLGRPRKTEKTTVFFVSGKPATWPSLTKALADSDILFEEQTINETNHTLVIFTEDTLAIAKILRENEYEIIELPLRRGTAAEEIVRIDRAEIKENQKIVRRTERAKELAKNLPEIKKVADYIFWQKSKHNILSSSKMTTETLVFEGWCPTNKVAILEEKIALKTSHFVIEKINPEENEQPPVEIENNALISPFEAVTRLYGLPGPKDIDPTLFLSGFFFIFFGLSLTDVGYGIFLTAVTAFVLLRYRVPKEIKPLITLIMFGGIASMFIGLVFGGYLGIDMSLMPAWVQAMQQFDPISNPIPVFYLALALGVIQILSGLVLSIVSKAKNGNLVDGILDAGPWIFLFVTLMLWGANIGGMLAGLATYYVWGIYVAVASLVLTQGRKEKSLFGKMAKGIISLYDSIGYFSDILSYSRLLALGLATSALAFAVNLIAAMVKDVPYVGFLLMVIILIIGHLFNLAVNTLGAFIHGARLQFVEFFGKFITGTGKNFKPFKREERYVVISNE